MKVINRISSILFSTVLLAGMFLLTACGGESSSTIEQQAPQQGGPAEIQPSKDFISRWQTKTSDESITLPLRNGFNYDFSVDWADGSPVAEVTSDTDPDATHVYEDPGVYEVVVKGLVQAWYFNRSGSKDKIIEVVSLGKFAGSICKMLFPASII